MLNAQLDKWAQTIHANEIYHYIVHKVVYL
jgi:hypothetical protein